MKIRPNLLVTVAALALSTTAWFSLRSAFADASVTTVENSMTPGYTETYDFSINGKAIGTQMATLVNVNGGNQTWTFSIDLVVPTNGTTISLKQTGGFTLDSTIHPLSYNTVATINGKSQGEKITFAGGQATVDLDPPVAAIAHSFPVTAQPYLLVNNLITILSLETQAQHKAVAADFVLPSFSTSTLQNVTVVGKPQQPVTNAGKTYLDYVITISASGLPDTSNELWLDSDTGAIDRYVDRAQGVAIVKE